MRNAGSRSGIRETAGMSASAVWFENAVRKWRAHPFRTFVHSPTAMERMIEGAGFELASRRCTLAWSADVFVKRA